jgi:Holliday junction DNA helicase RuvA
VIAHLEGTVREREGDTIVVDVGGVGYEVVASHAALLTCDPGAVVHLPTHLQVREDAFTLYGFGDADERRLFRILLQVSGVGPRLALAIISTIEPERIQRAIATQDTALLSSVPGVGRKTAERICIDLQDRMAGLTTSGRSARRTDGPADPHREAREALVGLGYPLADAETALEGVEGTAEERVRAALAALSGGR